MANINPVNIGLEPNDGTGDSLRTAFDKVNQNLVALNDEIIEHTHDDRYYRKDEVVDLISDAGGGDMLKAQYDINGDGIVNAADSAPWSGITGKPSTFPPSAHDHDSRYYTKSEVNNLLADVGGGGEGPGISPFVELVDDTVLTADHLGKTLVYSGSVPIEVTVSSEVPNGFYCSVINHSEVVITFGTEPGMGLYPEQATLYPTISGVAAAHVYHHDGSVYVITGEYVIQSFILAASDEETDLTTGAAKVTFRMPYPFIVTEVRASVSAAPTGSAIWVNINRNGESILGSALTIQPNSKTSYDGPAPWIDQSFLDDDDEITIDIDQVGSTTPGKGLKVTLIGYRTKASHFPL